MKIFPTVELVQQTDNKVVVECKFRFSTEMQRSEQFSIGPLQAKRITIFATNGNIIRTYVRRLKDGQFNRQLQVIKDDQPVYEFASDIDVKQGDLRAFRDEDRSVKIRLTVERRGPMGDMLP